MQRDWSFARRPFWLFSHVFAATVVVSFVLLGFWQLSRHVERADRNQLIEERSEPPAIPIDEVLPEEGSDADVDPAGLDYRLVTASGEWESDDVVRVANRSQDGLAGEHVVSLFRMDDGRHLLVNRGFVPLGDGVVVDGVPSGPVTLEGWLRPSVERGWLQAADDGEGPVPRLNVDDIASRIDVDPEPVWLQAAPPGGAGTAVTTSATYPEPVPLPALTGGPHLSYMGQWWVFAALGVAFYLSLLRRNAAKAAVVTPVPLDGERPADQEASAEPGSTAGHTGRTAGTADVGSLATPDVGTEPGEAGRPGRSAADIEAVGSTDH